MVIKRWIWAVLSVGAVIATFPLSGLASTAVRFSKTDLDAFVTLVKPELTTLRVDGRKGQFQPGPSLVFVGLEPQDFDIDLNNGAELVDLRFHEVRAQAPTLSFEKNLARLEIAFADQDKAIRSALGSIHFRGIKVVAWISVSSEGGIRVRYDHGELQGELKGTGLLKPRFVIDLIRKTVLKSLKTEVERTLSRPAVQASIEKGFVTWAQFSSEGNATRVRPNSVSISEAGIAYEAE